MPAAGSLAKGLLLLAGSETGAAERQPYIIFIIHSR